MDKLTETVKHYDEILEEVRALSEGKGTLVLASKTVDRSLLEGLAAERPGVIFGENRVQELLSKYFTAEGLTWHFIGHLQTNKVKYIADKVSLIQSVDSLRLAEEIEKQSGKIGKRMDVLVEINVGGESSKGGILPEEAYAFAERVAAMPHLRLRGVMSVLPDVSESTLIPLYRRLKELYDAISSSPFAPDADILSAGMSGDYRIALQCGSNMVRIGSAVFGARNYAK